MNDFSVFFFVCLMSLDNMYIFMEIKSSIYFDFLVVVSLIPSSWGPNCLVVT